MDGAAERGVEKVRDGHMIKWVQRGFVKKMGERERKTARRKEFG